MKILIKDLVLYGYHGVRDHEKKDGQDFIFNICVSIKDGGLKDSDKLECTLSYSDVIREIKEINKSRRCDLLETLCRIAADRIMGISSLVEKVDIRIEKPNPPIDEKLGSVGVEYGLFRKDKDADSGGQAEVYLSLGSNMGDREGNIRKALDLLENDPHIDIVRTSSFYETDPMYIEDQESFYNIAAKINVGGGMDSFILLGLIKGIEYNMGRKSWQKRYGPRPIDIDILYFGDKEIKSDILEIPHPLIAERKFVLIPLAEIAPRMKIEGTEIKKYLEKKKLSGRVERV